MDDSSEKIPLPPSPEIDSDELLQAAMTGLKARGDASRRFAAMQLPDTVFESLCKRLLDKSKTVKSTAEWLSTVTPEAPTRSSIERFSDALYEEYRLAHSLALRKKAERYVQTITAGDPDAMQLAANNRLTELLTDNLLSMETIDDVKTNRLSALIYGVGNVAKISLEKQRIAALVATADKRIEVAEMMLKEKSQKLSGLAERITKLQKRVEQAQSDQQSGRQSDPAIYQAIRAELIAMGKEAA